MLWHTDVCHGPALRVDGERIQGSLSISRFLDRLQPSPPLFPADPARRHAVEEAEAWGEGVLQVVPRRLLRFALVRDPSVRRMLARANRLPFTGLMAALMKPLAWHFARRSGADEETVRRHLAELRQFRQFARQDVLRRNAFQRFRRKSQVHRVTWPVVEINDEFGKQPVPVRNFAHTPASMDYETMLCHMQEWLDLRPRNLSGGG